MPHRPGNRAVGHHERWKMKEQRRIQLELLGSHARARSQMLWRPLADVYRTRTGWLLKFDLAGVRMEDVCVGVSGSRITVSGIRRDWAVEDICCYYLMEIAYNKFERVIDLPCDLAEAQLGLELRDGLMLVRITTPR